MIVAADDIGYAHQRIVYHDGEVIRRSAVRACDDKIIQDILDSKFDLAFYAVVDHDLAA